MNSMTRKLMIASALSFGLMAAPAAMADRDGDRDRGARHGESRGLDRHDRHGRDDDRRGHDQTRRHDRDDRHGRYERRDHRDHRNHRHQWDARRHASVHHQWHGPRYSAPRYQAPRGYVRHHWRAGHRLPSSYHHHRHVVHDYHSYRLRQPPHGHHWVRVDNDVVLTAVATGVVAAVVYGLFQ